MAPDKTETRETMDVDVLIVGAGPAGLAAGIRLRQLAAQHGRDLSVAIVEKGSEAGAHILSGAVIEPRALDELLPDWKMQGAPIGVPVASDEFRVLTRHRSIRLPTPRPMHNKGNYIVSLSNICRWLAVQAESLGVQLFAGFPAADMVIEAGRFAGIVTGDFGVARDGSRKPSYQPGIVVRASVTLLAEGCRGSLSERVMKQFDLRADVDPQTYGLGIKELWEIDPERYRPGHVVHTVGWPMDNATYGGSFQYHMENNQLAIGFVVGLDYRNVYLDPYEEFQRFKTHPAIAPVLAGGKRIGYGARALNEGGFQSMPKLTFPGGALIGCAAGFLNVPKIKGSHTAMKSGMLAAEAAFAHITAAAPLADYEANLRASWVGEELYRVRNIRPGFQRGLVAGLVNAAIDTYLWRGKAPWTRHNHADYATLKPAAECAKMSYPGPDGKVTFDRLSSVYLSGTAHEENQPVHLTLKDASVPVSYNLPVYAEPAQRYCPAGVYEIVEETSGPRLQINAQNCVHCKTCDIKDPSRNIVWTTPEGGGGPNYSGM